jgi:hypothetical protein
MEPPLRGAYVTWVAPSEPGVYRVVGWSIVIGQTVCRVALRYTEPPSRTALEADTTTADGRSVPPSGRCCRTVGTTECACIDDEHNLIADRAPSPHWIGQTLIGLARKRRSEIRPHRLWNRGHLLAESLGLRSRTG